MAVSTLLKIGKAIVSNSGKIAKSSKPAIPRYLYHVTTKKNYEAMLKSGEIIGSHDGNFMSNLEGVFMFDLKNFLKRWSSTYFKCDNGTTINLGAALIGKNRTDAVVLRVPTKNFNVDKLKIRAQDNLNSTYHGLNGDYARFQSLYTRNKKPIEYIYGQNIKMSDVQKVGEINIGIPENFYELENGMEFFKRKPFKELLEIFRGSPEEKGVLAFKRANIKNKVLKLK